MSKMNHQLVSLAVVGLLFSQVHLALSYDSAAYKDPHYVDRRTTMVHLFEWKWKDIAEECERFLGPMGYAGVQVSPINENLVLKNRPWFERYQPMSYKMITRSGNEEEFADMVARCNKAGVRIYVDAVLNHMTTDVTPAVGTAGSTADPPKRIYAGVPFGPEDFNAPCVISNYSNGAEVRNCDLVSLHDLDQGKEHVRGKIVEFLNRAVDHGIAGFRVDAAKHMWPADLEIIYSRTKNLRSDVFGENKRPFIYQEVIDLGNEGVSKWQYVDEGRVIEFSFGIQLGQFFRGWNELKTLEHWGFIDNGLLKTDDALVMIDNHDNQRGHGAGGAAIINYKLPRIYKMAVAFMLAHPYGATRVMSSFDFSDPSQGPPADSAGNLISPDPVIADVVSGADANPCGHGWVCEHRWSQIYGMVEFRNVAQGETLANWWSNGQNQIAFSRGNRGFVAFNGQSDADLKQELQTGLPAGKYCDVITGRKINGKCTGKTVNVNADGKAYIEILKDAEDTVLAVHAQTKL